MAREIGGKIEQDCQIGDQVRLNGDETIYDVVKTFRFGVRLQQKGITEATFFPYGDVEGFFNDLHAVYIALTQTTESLTRN